MSEVRNSCDKGVKEVRQENDAVAYVCAKYVKLTNIRAFPNAAPTKAQALKVLEEASETVEACKKWFIADGFQKCNAEKVPADWADTEFNDLMDEIADTIQASCNLAAALGVTDLTPYLARCEERNRRRGRYDE